MELAAMNHHRLSTKTARTPTVRTLFGEIPSGATDNFAWELAKVTSTLTYNLQGSVTNAPQPTPPPRIHEYSRQAARNPPV